MFHHSMLVVIRVLELVDFALEEVLIDLSWLLDPRTIQFFKWSGFSQSEYMHVVEYVILFTFID